MDGEIGEYLFLFNGEYGVATDDNGLYYMRARYYNVDIKRFMNQDVIVGSVESSPSLNRYAYVEGNPVNYLDPFGLEKLLYDSSELHDLLNDMNRFLTILSVVFVVIGLVCPAVLPEMVILAGVLGIVSTFVTLGSLILYCIDAYHAFQLDDESRFLEASEGAGWEVISLLLGSFRFDMPRDNLIWTLTGVIDQYFTEFVQMLENEYEYGY